MRQQLLGVAKRKIAKSITELSSSARFSIIYGEFRIGTLTTQSKKYPAGGRPTFATPARKGGALQFLTARSSEGSTSIREDLLAALKSAGQLTSRRKTIIYVGDGYVRTRTDHAQVAREITSANVAKVVIHTIGVTPYPESEVFLKALAAMNGGTYKRVE